MGDSSFPFQQHSFHHFRLHLSNVNFSSLKKCLLQDFYNLVRLQCRLYWIIGLYSINWPILELNIMCTLDSCSIKDIGLQCHTLYDKFTKLSATNCPPLMI